MQEEPGVEEIKEDLSPPIEKRLGPQGTNVVLVGLSGSGKSSTGWHLAKALGWGFIDLDSWVEKKTGKKITDIFEGEGEAAFRKYEIDALKEIAAVRNHVIATGGGVASSDEAWNLAARLGVIVWLDTTVTEMARRLAAKSEEISGRPLLAKFSDIAGTRERALAIEKELTRVLEARRARLEKASIALTLTFVPPDIAAHQIAALLRKGDYLRPRRNP